MLQTRTIRVEAAPVKTVEATEAVTTPKQHHQEIDGLCVSVASALTTTGEDTGDDEEDSASDSEAVASVDSNHDDLHGMVDGDTFRSRSTLDATQ